jgi:glutathione synthase/RimK-type ligase-like ATP-grasp enzyme
MDRGSLATHVAPVRRKVGGRYRKWTIARNLPPMPTEAVVPLDEAGEALLLCSRYLPYFVPQTHVSELAFAHQLAARGRAFAVTGDARKLFDKSVAWFIPGDGRDFILPRLWDYSRQVFEFAAGLERQGNRPFCSSTETEFWENKAHMHRKLAEMGAPTPRTEILTADTWVQANFDVEPALIKEEHSAASAGVHHFSTAAQAREFVASYRFRPGESLIMQELVLGATKDMRLTMVGERLIESATYWRVKSPEALAKPEWTTTATSNNPVVLHEDIPPSVEAQAAEWLRKLGIRTAGIDLMWVDDDVSRDPVILELSPYYQPNPPKPERYAQWTYKEYKKKLRNVRDSYVLEQYRVFGDIAGAILDQDLF